MKNKDRFLSTPKRRNWVKSSMDKFTSHKIFKVKKFSLLEKEADKEIKEYLK
tara:strand:+ start:216 stop:371 length:156 start_codon:yes stop_codon:yes gene_type:complete